MDVGFSNSAAAAILFIRAAMSLDERSAARQDYIDLAMLAKACGEQDLATILMGTVALEMGFSDEGLRRICDFAAQIGLTCVIEPTSVVKPRDLFMLDQAIEELRHLTLFAEPGLHSAMADDPAHDGVASTEGYGNLDHFDAAIAEIFLALHSLLQKPQMATLPLLEMLTGASRSRPAFDMSLLAGRDIRTVGNAIAFNRLQRLVTLLEPLVHSAPNLDLISRLSPTGLGPYFSNVPNLARSPDDLFLLLEMALPGASSREVEHWLPLLSTHLTPSNAIYLAVEAARREMPRSARVLLLRTIERRGLYPDALAQLRQTRDASLDLGWADIALSAQDIIAGMRPADAAEFGILGDLLLACGRPDEASAAFFQCLDIDPAERRAVQALSQSLDNGGARRIKNYFLA